MQRILILIIIVTTYALCAKGQDVNTFSILNYNPNIIEKKLNIDSTELTFTEQFILNTYLRHPEMVSAVKKQAKKKTDNKQLAPDIEDAALAPVVSQIASNDGDAKKKAEATGDIPAENVEMFVKKPSFWTFKGDYYLQFLQNYVSDNWYKGGASSYAMMGNTTLQYNYDNKKKVKWDNKLELRLGFQTMETDTVNKFKTSDDLIRYTSKLGIQAHKQWYYTLQVIAATQFARGLKNNDTKTYSDFMSPFTLNVSLGMDYTIKTKNDVLTGTLHFAPLAFDLRYVDRLGLATKYGIKEGHHTLEDFGSGFTANVEWKPVDFFKWKTYLYLYTSYHRFELQWENTLTLQFNKFISANLYIYPRFDDNAKRVDDMSYWQLKEYLSFGFSYSM